ncbi:MAG: hypothetical protein HY291_15080 [Planctomycetes bacterium]|nr:hypothetical protein [Planctomycetota bacterium]
MLRNALLSALLAGFALCVNLPASDAELAKEVEQLKKDLDQFKKDKASDRAEIEGLKKQRSDAKAPISSAQAAVENKYGPNAAVTTKQGKLQVFGLLQVWYYSIQNDNIGFFGNKPGLLGGDTNEGKDNDSFSIRRTELGFTMDIHENVRGVIMFDPARTLDGRPAFPSNVGLFATKDTPVVPASVQNASAGGNGKSILKDAFINYHGIVPHHDFQIGQFKSQMGEEGIRPSSQIDFVERSMIGQLCDNRDLGVSAHGTWWDDRFQYWLGTFDSAGNWFFTSGNDPYNRVDDNDEKSILWRILVRPVWKHETWGSMELGASGEHAVHGEAGPLTDGLGRRQTDANRYYAWGSYRPGGPVKGWWLKGEWAWIEDRNAPGAVAKFDTNGFLNTTTAGNQTFPRPIHVTGFYIATGYKISDSVFKDSAPGWLKNFEFDLRYEEFQNIMVADLVRPNNHTDIFATKAWTGGINYYIKGDNAKIQLNYVVVDNPDDNTVRRGFPGAVGTATGPRRNFHAVDNNSLLVNFQVAW